MGKNETSGQWNLTPHTCPVTFRLAHWISIDVTGSNIFLHNQERIIRWQK